MKLFLSKNFIFNSYYFVAAVVIFCIEVGIALFIHDKIIRPYIGDVLVVMLIYCILKSFLDIPVLRVALIVLGFSFFVEFLQYVQIVERLGLEKSKISMIIIGTSFSWMDLIAYLVGIVLVLIVEKHLLRKSLLPISKMS